MYCILRDSIVRYYYTILGGVNMLVTLEKASFYVDRTCESLYSSDVGKLLKDIDYIQKQKIFGLNKDILDTLNKWVVDCKKRNANIGVFLEIDKTKYFYVEQVIVCVPYGGKTCNFRLDLKKTKAFRYIMDSIVGGKVKALSVKDLDNFKNTLGILAGAISTVSESQTGIFEVVVDSLRWCLYGYR